MTAEQRLDTVEDDLDVVKKLLVSAARYAESANQGLDRLTERFDDLAAAQTNTQARFDDLTAAQDRTQALLDQLGSRIDQLVESQSQAFTRLDRIERALDTLASNQLAEREARLSLREDLEILYQGVQLSEESTERALNRLAESQQANNAAVNNLSGRDDLLAAHLSQLTLTVNRLAESQQSLAESQQANEVAMNNLARLVVRLVETAEADRAEIRRIWEYLLHQSGNGSSG